MCDCCAEAEQRVIDRLAREAGCNPYAGDTVCWCPDDWREPFDKARCPQHGGAAYESQRSRRWREGAARGVAAERARTEKLREALRILSDPDDPPFADWAFFHRAEDREEASQEFARAALAALAPERTTKEA